MKVDSKNARALEDGDREKVAQFIKSTFVGGGDNAFTRFNDRILKAIAKARTQQAIEEFLK